MKATDINAKGEKVITVMESTKSEMEDLHTSMKKEKVEIELQYQALREQLKISIREMQTLLDTNSTLGQGMTQTLRSKLLELQLQLESPGESIIDDLKVHLANIKKMLAEIIGKLEKENPFNETLENIQNSLHRYRIKFEILKLQFALGKMELKDVASNAKHKATRKVIALRKFIHENEEVAKKNWKNFRHEVDEAYSDLHKVLH